MQHQRGQQQQWQLQHDCSGDNDNNGCSRSGSSNITTSSGRTGGGSAGVAAQMAAVGARTGVAAGATGMDVGAAAEGLLHGPSPPPPFIYLFIFSSIYHIIIF